jgi:hypothetical protein
MPTIVCNASFQYDVSKEAELDSECLCFHEFPERRFERNEAVHHREGCRRIARLISSTIRAKLRLKIEDNRLHSNGELRQGSYEAIFNNPNPHVN